MIDFIEGTIEEIRENYIVINTGGVGYGVHITSGTYYRLKNVSGQARVYTYLNVRENAAELFGFFSPGEKEMFKALLSINGIGAKAGINILSGITADKLKAAIASGDSAALTSAPGLGAKKAKRIVVELKDKFAAFAEGGETGDIDTGSEYLQVLTSLGFSFTLARKALGEVMSENEGADREEIIREALKKLGR